MKTKNISLLTAFLALTVVAFTKPAEPYPFYNIALAAATKAAAKFESGLHLVVVQDDGREAPIVGVIAFVPLGPSETAIEKNLESGKTKIRFTGQALIRREGRELLLNGRIDGKIDFGSIRWVNKGGLGLGEYLPVEESLQARRLEKGAPKLIAANHSSNAPGQPEFNEGSALFLVWK